MAVFNPNVGSHLVQPMFLGDEVSTARYELVKHPWIDKLTDKQLAFFWRPEEVDLGKDRIDFSKLSEAEQFMFIANLKYQTLLDSVQGRGVNLALLPIVSLPELETFIETWGFSETIHSRSYTHIIRNVFNNPTEILDTITITPEIIERAASVTVEYDKLIQLNSKYVLNNNTHSSDKERKEHMSQIYRTLASINILEAIRFYVSFACSWSFNERKLMEGNAKIIKFIARDEANHMAASQLILKEIMSGNEGSDWKHIAELNKEYVLDMFDQAVMQEKDWANYLFSQGSIIGLNAKILSQFIEYIANVRLRALGFTQRYDTKTNPLPWVNSYLSSDTVQVAPQEVELSSYLTGAVDTSLNMSALSDFKL